MEQKNPAKLVLKNSLKNKFEFFAFDLLSKSLNFLGLERSRKFAKGLGYIFFYLIPLRKKTVIENLKIAFPEFTNSQIQKTALKTYQNFAIIFCEMLLLPEMSFQQLNEIVYCNNLHIIENKVQEDKGLIFLTAHFGNWEMGASWMGARLNAPIYVVAKPQRNEFVTNWLTQMREHFGNKVIFLGASIKNLFIALKQKKLIGMLSDQRGPKEGMRVNFFNKQTSVYSGAALLSLKTGAPIVVALIIRQPDYRYKVELHSIKPDDFPEVSEDELVFLMTQKYMKILEDYIKQNPSFWFWMHKIWKY